MKWKRIHRWELCAIQNYNQLQNGFTRSEMKRNGYAPTDAAWIQCRKCLYYGRVRAEAHECETIK